MWAHVFVNFIEDEGGVQLHMSFVQKHLFDLA